MQECRDIFGKIEISTGMWHTYKNTHFKLPTKSQTPKNNNFRAKIRFFFFFFLNVGSGLILGSVGLRQYNIFFFFGLSIDYI